MAFASPEQKFGIKIQERRQGRNLEQNASMILGSIYIVAGIIGFFVSGFGNFTEMSGRYVLGLFEVNPYHNIVHIGIGLLWLLGAFALTRAGNEGLNIAIGGVYVLATVIGFMGYLALLSIPPGPIGDNWLHLATALATLIFGSGILRVLSGRQLTATA